MFEISRLDYNFFEHTVILFLHSELKEKWTTIENVPVCNMVTVCLSTINQVYIHHVYFLVSPVSMLIWYMIHLTLSECYLLVTMN